MSRRNKKNRGRFSPLIILEDGTWRFIFSILSFVAAIFFLLAYFNRAGIAGKAVYGIFKNLFGVGYFLFPLFLIGLSVMLFLTRRPRLAATTALGGLLFFVSGLAIISAFGKTGGVAGNILSAPFIALFDIFAAKIILSALLLISLLVLFNATPATISGVFSAITKRLRSFKRVPQESDAAETYKSSLYSGNAREGLSLEPTRDTNKGESVNENIDSEYKKEPQMTAATPLARALSQTTGSLFSFMRPSAKTYTPPPLSLLEEDRGTPGVGDIKANVNIIKRTLQNFGIDVEMDEVLIGPSITRYALKPAQGIKLSRIVGLQNDLSLALAAHPLRIEAPIPGRSLVGIEIPNSKKTTVGLGSLLKSSEMKKAVAPLSFPIGRSITGNPIVDDLNKMPHLLIAGATGSGKTCGKDTYIFSEKGMLTFEELCPLPMNSEVNYTLRIATRDGIETTSKNYNNGDCDFYKIITEEGFSIEITDEHPLWAIRNGECGWQNGGNIYIGEYVAISRGAKCFGVNKEIDFVPPAHKTNKPRDITIPTKITEELGLFMGLLAADGGLTVKNRIVYTQANKEVLTMYVSLLKNLFNITAPVVTKSGKSNKAKDVIVHSKQLKNFLAHLGMEPVGAQKKEIPKSIRESSSAVVRAFIQGLVRNDGHVSPLGEMEITLANKNLLQQLQLLLLNFGVVSSVRPKKVKNYIENDYWRLAVYGAEFAAYAKEIGFLTNEEKSRAERIFTLSRNANKDIIPTLAPLLQKLRSVYRAAFAKLTNNGLVYLNNMLVPKYAFRSLASYNSGLRNPSYNALQRILAFYEPTNSRAEYKQLSKIYKDNFYWAKVKTIKRTRGVGYDFEVPGSNSFVGNGFVNHNSVAIHTIITSLLYRNSPAHLRLIMIDRKRVELTLYNNIPHLLTPVITDPKKAILALKWAGKEMDRRFDILEAEAVRDVTSYHKNIVEPAYAKQSKEATAEQKEKQDLPETMPYIVIIIDELADLMNLYPRELESAIVRIAQMSRAVGIHLILSTQRPQVNIITGLIKANISARIAFQVASQTDSRTILDGGGAEKLLGAGDMLYLAADMSKPVRLQSAYIGEPEIKKVTAFLVQHNKNGIFNAEVHIEEHTEDTPFAETLDDDVWRGEMQEDDELYEEARAIVINSKKASTTYLQRKLKIGYARAARIMDMLEERGVVGPGEGAKPREVLVSADEDTYEDEHDKEDR